MLERRGFLSFLAGGVAGLLLPDTIIVEPAKLTAAVPLDLSTVTLRTLTEAMAAEFDKQMHAYDIMVRGDGYKIGDYSFNKQYTVAIGLPIGETSDVHDRFLIPATSALVDRCKRDKVKKLGNLPLPRGPIEAVSVGPIRGIEFPYWVMCDNGAVPEGCPSCGRTDYRPMFRFDVLAAA